MLSQRYVGSQTKVKKSKLIYLFAVLLALGIIVPQVQAAQSVSQTLPSSGTIMQVNATSAGLNYDSLYHAYSTSDAILNRDFSQFKHDGISVISLSMYWYRLEGNIQGDYGGNGSGAQPYGDAFLANIKHVITVANQYGLKVLLTFHTLWGTDSNWCTPTYVVDPISGTNDGLAIVRNDTMRQAFIDMFNHTVNYLAGTPGIWAWAVLNEPWYWGRTANEHDFITSNGQTQKENFITLIQQLSTIVKTNDGRPTTVRFCDTSTYTSNGVNYIKNIFQQDWGMDPRIFSSLSFISFNPYLPTDPSLVNSWENMNTVNVQGTVNQGDKVWITEFGINSDSDSVQSAGIVTSVAFFKTLPVEGWIAWCWEGDCPLSGGNPDNYGQAFNLCASANGQPRPAYYNILS